MKTLGVVACAAAIGAGLCMAASGADAADPPAATVPQQAFFIGAGGGFGSTRFTDQTLYAQGVSTIYLGGVEVGSGWAGGPTTPGFDGSDDLTGGAQLGFFSHFAGSDWLWGAKLSFTYLGAEAEIEPVVVPQFGSFTGTGPMPGTFTGNVVARSYSTRLDSQFALVPFLGRSFGRGFVYLGAGPTLSRMEYDFDDVFGFADLSGVHYDITGWSDSYSSSSWVWGGQVVIGATYFVSADWFVDLSYSYSATEKASKGYAGPFATQTRDGYTDNGILSGSFSGRAQTQTVMLSLNRAF